jgi:flagellar hook assembly protein FlgD
LYPNPSTGTLNISFESNTEEAEVNIYDISGNTVFTKKYKTEKGSTTINEDISKLKDGNYFLLLNDGEKILNQNLSINNKQ